MGISGLDLEDFQICNFYLKSPQSVWKGKFRLSNNWIIPNRYVERISTLFVGVFNTDNSIQHLNTSVQKVFVVTLNLLMNKAIPWS